MRAVFFNDGYLKITDVRRRRYWLPIHTKNYLPLADPRFDVDQFRKRGPKRLTRDEPRPAAPQAQQQPAWTPFPTAAAAAIAAFAN
jgi:hypothetical protein